MEVIRSLPDPFNSEQIFERLPESCSLSRAVISAYLVYWRQSGRIRRTVRGRYPLFRRTASFGGKRRTSEQVQRDADRATRNEARKLSRLSQRELAWRELRSKMSIPALGIETHFERGHEMKGEME